MEKIVEYILRKRGRIGNDRSDEYAINPDHVCELKQAIDQKIYKEMPKAHGIANEQ